MYRSKLLFATTLLLAGASLMRAQSPSGGTSFLDIIAPGQELGFTIKQNYEHNFNTGLKGGYAGEMSVNRYTTGLDYNTNWDRGFWRVGFGYELNDWQWSGPNYVDDTYDLTLQTIFGQRFVDSDWGMFGVLGASLGAEVDGGDLGRGGSYRAGLGVTYYFDEHGKHTISFGVMAVGEEERDMYALPLWSSTGTSPTTSSCAPSMALR